MTVFYGEQATILAADGTPGVGMVNGTVRVSEDQFTMAAQTTSDTIVVGRLPKGAVFLYGVISASATMGASATVAIGITGATGKYRAAAGHTAVVPTLFGVAAAVSERTTAEEDVFITIAVASLAAAGTVNVQLYYSVD